MATSNSPRLDSRDNQISKDGLGFNNPIPLSPQWLQTKPGENKTGVSTGENQLSPYSGHSGRPAHVTKSPGNGEEVHDVQKRKDVFRPSVLDAESGRRDHWRDEERETNTSVRRDRWREGDKELGDHRKVDRWTDNPSVRQLGEVRRAPPERWTDSSNKDNNHDQRRGTKWNTRWGPDHKENDSSREKWLDHGKDATDVSLDKGFSHHTSQGKDGKDGDHYRPWRSNSFASRGKADSPHQQTALPNKQISSFVQSQGQGRGENGGTTFSLGRGRVPSGGNSYNNLSNYPHSPGSFAEKGENHDPSSLRYSRTKLLDLYRNTDMGSLVKILDGIAQVPSLTQEEPVEPLAFCVPSSEELVVIEGIDKGDVLSSGVTQSAKDGSVGRGSIDNTPSRRTRLGSREDVPGGPDGNDMSKGKEDGAPYRRNDQVIASKESSMQGISSVQSSSAWRSLSMKEHTHSASLDRRDVPSDGRSRTSDFSWPQSQKDLSNNLGKIMTWENDQVIRRQLSSGLDREQEQRTLSQPPPEELVLFYIDPRGETQGPFSGVDIIGWFEGGYFGLDLLNSYNNLSNYPHSPGSFAEKGENHDPSSLRYSRTKLLDLYRNTDMGSLVKILDGIAQVPSLTQEEPVEPLAFCVPSSEELVVIEGIDKGDVLSSGVTQSAKDGSVGRGSIDNTPSRRTRLGSREDVPVGPDGNDMSKGKEDGAPYRRNDQVIASKESSMQGISSVQSSSAWRSLSMKEHTHSASLDRRDVPSDGRSRTSDFSWPQSQKDLSNNLGKIMTWENDQVIRRQLSSGLDREQEQRTLSQPPPEELVLFYIDPRGETQGPFSGVDIIGWFEGGYFGLDLLVRLENAPTDMPFTPLGDVMPHLRSKARPPPGFAAPKQNEMTDAVNRPNISNLGKLHASSSEVDMTRDDARYMQGSTDVASRFLESLMSGNMNTPAENYAPGIQSYYGSGAVPSLGTESGDNLSLLVKRMTLERQSSLPNPNPFWPGRDAPSVGPKAEYLRESSQQSNIPSSITDNPRSQLHSQNADFSSILQGLSDKSSPVVNNGASGWSNFPVQGGSDPLQDKLNLLRGQNGPPQAAFQQRLQSPNQPSLTSLLGQGVDNISGMLNRENLLSSGLSQDPQLLSLLQQQYLMQLQSQNPAPSQQLSVLDKLLLLQQQQQKQDEQQQMLRQQQLLSQVLSEQQSRQHFSGTSHGQLQAASLLDENASVGLDRFQTSHEVQTGAHIQVPNIPDERLTNFTNLPPNISQGTGIAVSSEASSIHLPREIFGNAIHQKGWGTNSPEPIDDIQSKASLLASPGVNTSQVLDNRQQKNLFPNNINTDKSERSEAGRSYSSLVQPVVPVTKPNVKDEILLPEQSNDLNVTLGTVSPGIHSGRVPGSGSSIVKEVKSIDGIEVMKGSEKKSRKQKSLKAQSSDQAKKVHNVQQPKESEFDVRSSFNSNSESQTFYPPQGSSHEVPLQETQESKSDVVTGEIVDHRQGKISLPGHSFVEDGEIVGTKSVSGHRGWKPSPGLKPKSFLEIQQEEQNRAHADMSEADISHSLGSTNFSSPTPWAGVVANSDCKPTRESQLDGGSLELQMGSTGGSASQKRKKSQLHDLLAEEVVKPSVVRIPDNKSNMPLVSTESSEFDSVDDGNFIEAKDNKKNRKKSAKAKNSGRKVSVPAASADVSFASSPIEKAKSSSLAQQDKEVLPAVLSGPSLGDFVPWKGENANTSAAPAWCTDSGKLPKPTSLRDILKEQGKKVSTGQHVNSIQIPHRSLPTHSTRGNGSSKTITASSPAKVASAVQNTSQASSQTKNKVDDDFFWGPLDQPKQETKQSDFPQLASQGSWGKNSSVKRVLGGSSVSVQKSMSNRTSDFASPASARSSSRGKKDAVSKQSEAVDFRNWCQSECVKLIGTKDTSFLEFCLKQTRSEAEILLTENLGPFDPKHEFIEKFLNYKDFLPANVLEIALQGQNDQKVTGYGPGDVNSALGGFGNSDQGEATVPDGTTKGGGKKKGRKGKKVSPAVLGFNVVSNRIMMGEIQVVED